MFASPKQRRIAAKNVKNVLASIFVGLSLFGRTCCFRLSPTSHHDHHRQHHQAMMQGGGRWSAKSFLSMVYINGDVSPSNNDGGKPNELQEETPPPPLISEEGDDDSLYTEIDGIEGLYYTSNDKSSGRQMALMWCGTEFCKDTIRERVVGDRNQIVLAGPATGQVAFWWMDSTEQTTAAPNKSSRKATSTTTTTPTAAPSVLLLVKQNDDALIKIAAQAVEELTSHHVHVLLDPELSAKLKHYFGVDDDLIQLFEPRTFGGFGTTPSAAGDFRWPGRRGFKPLLAQQPSGQDPWKEPYPDLICTLGGDGLLMHAGMMFQGPVPPILCVAGGSLGSLTPFAKEELVDAVRIALGMITCETEECEASDFRRPGSPCFSDDSVNTYPPNMTNYPYKPLSQHYDELQDEEELLPPPPHAQQYTDQKKRFSFGWGDRICLSMRMRLECCILNREGKVQARINVLNEVVIDRGQSPYLANLECYCDDVHLTTVQADGIIFATPTGSTAYSMAAGGSVVHPSVPCILVTPICPHVLSFRSMVFPDHVVFRCYVPDDARAHASVAFDGRHRRELHRGDSVQVQMSPYPVPTINRVDHTSDWLGSLKRNFNFNSRRRQRPL